MTTKAETYIHELPVSGNSAGNKPTRAEAEIRHQRIAWLAYCEAEKRGFGPGRELDDWLEAESAEAEVI
jgi:hypothetical protein